MGCLILWPAFWGPADVLILESDNEQQVVFPCQATPPRYPAPPPWLPRGDPELEKPEARVSRTLSQTQEWSKRDYSLVWSLSIYFLLLAHVTLFTLFFLSFLLTLSLIIWKDKAKSGLQLCFVLYCLMLDSISPLMINFYLIGQHLNLGDCIYVHTKICLLLKN